MAAEQVSKAIPVVPDELRMRQQWVVWRYEERQTGKKPTKVPYNPRNGKAHAASDKPGTWGTFMQAIGCYKSGHFDGVGYVFSKDDPYTGIDLDHCIDPASGAIAPLAGQILSRLQSYTEYSPSGTGLHIIVRGSLPEGRRIDHTQGIEVYDCLKYFTFTGQRYNGFDTIHDRQEALTAIFHDFLGTPEEPTPMAAALPSTLDDATVLRIASGATDGPKFRALWDGNIAGYTSSSEADLALCNYLAFYSGNPDQTDSLFRQSGLMRDKWDERHRSDGRSYGQLTIDRAFTGRSEFYTPKKPEPTPPPTAFQQKSQERTKEAPTEPQEHEEQKSAPRYRFLTDDEIDNLPPIDWLAKGIIPDRAVGTVYGESQSCKTFFLLDMGMSFATGQSWKGVIPVMGHVAYIAGEDPEGVAERYRTWKHYYQMPKVPRFHLLDENVPLMLTPELLHLYTAIETLPETPRLIIIDTLSCAMVGADGNNTKDMIAFMEVVKAIRKRYQCTVMLAHHKNKNGGELGNVSFRNSCDVMIDMVRDGDVVSAKCEKMKNAPHFKPIHMTIQQHLTSAVLIARAGEIVEGGRLPENHTKALLTLHDTFPAGAMYTQWMKATGLAESTFARVLAALKQAGYVTDTTGKRGDFYTVTLQGKKYSYYFHESEIGA